MVEFFSAEHVTLIPQAWIYSGLFLVSLLEGVPVLGVLLPGGGIVVAAGTLAGAGVVHPIWVMVLAGIGSIIGDILGFLLLRQFSPKIKVLRRVITGVRDNAGRFADIFDRKYFMITVISRLIPFIRSAPSLVAAVRTVSIRGHIGASVVASSLWATTSVGVGYGLSEFFDLKYLMLALVVFCSVSVIWGVYKYIVSIYTSVS